MSDVNAPRRTRGVSGGVPVAAVLTLVPSLVLLLVPGLVIYVAGCGDSCELPRYHGPWTLHQDAWQWHVLFWGMAVPGTVTGCLVPWFLARHRPGWATAALSSAALLYAGSFVWYSAGSGDLAQPPSFWLSDPLAWLPYTMMVLGGASAIWLERRWLRSRLPLAVRPR